MEEKKINLEEIIEDELYNRHLYFNKINNIQIKNICLEFGRQLLELAAENSKIEIKTVGEELIITDIHQEDNYTRIQVNISSILNTIKQVE